RLRIIGQRRSQSTLEDSRIDREVVAIEASCGFPETGCIGFEQFTLGGSLTLERPQLHLRRLGLGHLFLLPLEAGAQLLLPLACRFGLRLESRENAAGFRI